MKSILSAVLVSLLIVAPCGAAPATTPTIAVVTFSSDITAESVEALVQTLQQQDQQHPLVIVLEMNTPGGDVGAGFVLAKALERLQTPLVCIADGEVDSMGFYVLQSCPLRVMTPRSRLMLHRPRMYLHGFVGVPELKDYLNNLETLTAAMDAHMCSRLKMDGKECGRRVASGDWWMTAEQALKAGACDDVIPSTKVFLALLAAAALS